MIHGLAGLEVDVRVLGRTADDWCIGVHGFPAEASEGVLVHQFFEIIIIKELNLLDFVGRTEPIKEVEEGNAAADSRQVAYGRKIEDLLDTSAGHHGKSRLTAGHDVTVVTKDIEGARCNRTGCHLEYAGEQFAGNLEHIGNHKEQPLGSRVGRCERSGLEAAVNRTGGTAFRLHFHEFDRAAKHVFLAIGSPFIRHLCHGGRRRNGVDGRCITKSIGCIGCRCVSIHHLGLLHCASLLLGYTGSMKLKFKKCDKKCKTMNEKIALFLYDTQKERATQA